LESSDRPETCLASEKERVKEITVHNQETEDKNLNKYIQDLFSISLCRF
jgi:hypothetical protein